MVAASTGLISATCSCRPNPSPRWRRAARTRSGYHRRSWKGAPEVAGALRPVVILMLVASVLFVVDGIFDGVYPGGPAWFTGKYDNLAEIAYVFAIVNTLVAYFVARGSERSLIARMSLSVFFLIERPLTAFVLGPKPITSIATHFATALVELVILLSALRVWRLGRSYAEAELDSLFALEGSTVGGLGAPAPGGSVRPDLIARERSDRACSPWTRRLRQPCARARRGQRHPRRAASPRIDRPLPRGRLRTACCGRGSCPGSRGLSLRAPCPSSTIRPGAARPGRVQGPARRERPHSPCHPRPRQYPRPGTGRGGLADGALGRLRTWP